MSRPYLVAWHLAGKKVVVIGAGSIGEGKIETLLGTGARIVVADPNPPPRVLDLAARGEVELRQRRARRRDFVGAALAVAATGNPHVNAELRRWAHNAGALVNAVDDPDRCDVTIPSVVRHGPATIAISTDGASPATARFLRETIAAALPAGLHHLVQQAADARTDLRRRNAYRYDYRGWRDGLLAPGLDMLRSGRRGGLGQLGRSFVDRFADHSIAEAPGSVTLVGAGPGAADLITMRGAAALARADVVLYDRLVEPEVLELAPPAARRIPVGKAKGSGCSQEQINDLIVTEAMAGNHVVRLKGGDPFVFGRGAEEVEAAAAAGLPMQVVPGLSSCTAAAALNGLSLTDRRWSAGFTVLSGHRIAEGFDVADGDDEANWSAAAASSGTIVVLMGATTAAEIASRLMRCGRPGDDAVAMVHAAGTSRERSMFGTLESVAETGCPYGDQTVLVIGPVVRAAIMTRNLMV